MILAIETATDICGVALVHKGEALAQRTVSEKNIHSEKLLPLVDDVLSDASLLLRDVEAIAVSIGPGSFTGLRIGLSTAKGLSTAVQKPIIAVPTLDALAFEFYRTNSKKSAGIVCPLIDAKRDEVFFCFYEINGAGTHRRTEYSIEPVARVIEIADSYDSVLFIGDGSSKMEKVSGLSTKLRCNPKIVCNPVSVGMAAEMEGKKLSAEVISTLEPLYIRDFIATNPDRKRDLPSHPPLAANQTSAHSYKG
ncbi:MAG: tRNA (adenosine(37)-N6)-threonylcarbamoyltransferase complex dimerization subunit type 1 TsaB [Bacteroidota bacterium]